MTSDEILKLLELPFDLDEEKMKYIKKQEPFVRKKVDAQILDFIQDNYKEVEYSYYEDLDNNKYYFEVNDYYNKGVSYRLEFDYNSMAHLLGISTVEYINYEKNGYKYIDKDQKEIKCDFFDEFCINLPNFFDNLSNDFMKKFSQLYSTEKESIKKSEAKRELTSYTLNWIRQAYKMFCVLNIGHIGDDIFDPLINQTYILKQNNRNEIYMVRKVISEKSNNDYILIEFAPSKNVWNPKGIKLIHITQEDLKITGNNIGKAILCNYRDTVTKKSTIQDVIFKDLLKKYRSSVENVKAINQTIVRKEIKKEKVEGGLNR